MSASGESSTTMHRLLHALGSHPITPPDDPKTNQYNQDLGLIHSTNDNHLESPNEGSSIDHQVTIYLHAQNITMFPANETWQTRQPAPEGPRGQTPVRRATENQQLNSTNKMRTLCMRTRLQPKAGSPRISRTSQQLISNQLQDSGHEEHQQQGSTDNPTQPEDPSVNITDTVKNPGPDPTSEDNNTDHQGPNPSHLQMVAYTADSEEDTRLSFLEVQVDLFGLKTLSIDSKMHSMESKLCSMNSNIDQMMDTQKSLKLEFGRHKHIFHDKMNTLAGTVTSSQTALKTSIIRQLAVQ
ncbi:filament-like plant protein 1 [Dorcoceras hygrometricum]|uniref:Filament-like plant protein 1 n=1 Tax=Dorcoceras hygrometricum TaxID=472368 RepID=A0A2Z7A8E4_9LAMI|nr:filament-like plant protein 1 [Dorcoceras hygrometricum]